MNICIGKSIEMSQAGLCPKIDDGGVLHSNTDMIMLVNIFAPVNSLSAQLQQFVSAL